MTEHTVLPTLKLVYLLGLAVLLFLIDTPAVIASVLLLQVLLWLYSRLRPALLARAARRLLFFFAVILLSYAFLPLGMPTTETWYPVTLGSWSLEVNLTGLGFAGLMCLRVLTIVLASLWVQNTLSADTFTDALRRLRVPAILAMAIDATLDMIAGSDGGGGGGGKGKGRGKKQAASLLFAQIRQGDLSFIQQMIKSSLGRAEKRISTRHPNLPLQQARDLAVIVGVAATIMGLKVIQVLPGLPVAPGHKNLLMVPLFLLAAHLTKTRFGGFWTGMTVGVVNFMLGYGKYGIFELAQFVLPGLLADFLLPLVTGRRRWLRLFQFALIGAFLGLGRFTANILVIILAGAPLTAFIIYLPMLFSQVLFGSVSALVSIILIHAGPSVTDTNQKNGQTKNNREQQAKPTTQVRE